MPRVIILDTFPLSSTAKEEPRSGAAYTLLDSCHQWVRDCVREGNSVFAPAICYYEALRELERLNATSQIARLRSFCSAFPGRFISITDADLDRAAKLWAKARNTGMPTASADALDADVVLAAQALNMEVSTSDYIIATTNPGHLTQFVPCDLWTNINP
jgi:predicted nucleic acid-binding protein